MVSGKLQIFILGFFLLVLGVLSESSLLPDATLLKSGIVSSSEEVNENSTEASKSYPLDLGATESSVDQSGDSSIVDTSNRDANNDLSDLVEQSELIPTSSIEGFNELSGSKVDFSMPLGSEQSTSPLVEKLKFDKLLMDTDEKHLSEYSPKNQEESILLLEDPNYTVDDALALLRKQRKIQEKAKGKKGQVSENLESEYEPHKIETPSSFRYEALRGSENEQSSSQGSRLDMDEVTYFPKELSSPKEQEEQIPTSISPSTNFEVSNRDKSEPSQKSFERKARDIETDGLQETEFIVSDKSFDDHETSNPFEIPVSEKSISSKNVEDESATSERDFEIYEKEKTASESSENTVSEDNQASQAEKSGAEQSTVEQPGAEQSTVEQSGAEQSTVEQSGAEQSASEEQLGDEEEKDFNDPQPITSIPSSESSSENTEVKELQSSDANEGSKSSKLESPLVGTDTESETENYAENSNQPVNEEDEDLYSNKSVSEIIPEHDDENSFGRTLLESRVQSGVTDEASQNEIMEKSQSNLNLENSPLFNSETFRNEESANQLRGILLPLVDMFQVSIGCAAPCPFQRYFIQTDRILKRISKIEAKTIELLNIMKKAREITIKEVSDLFKFHNTAIKRRALLFVQKYIKSIKLLNFKVDSAKKVVLLALKVRILLQLLPSKYTNEYDNEELERFSSQIDFAVKEYNSIKGLIGSKTIKFGLIKYLSLNEYDPTIKSIRSILESELSSFVSKMPTFQKFVSRHRKLAFALHEKMNKAGYPVKKRYFMIDRKGLSKEHFRLYKKKISEDNKQAKNRLGKNYSQFKNSQENKWKAFTKKVNSS